MACRRLDPSSFRLRGALGRLCSTFLLHLEGLRLLLRTLVDRPGSTREPGGTVKRDSGLARLFTAPVDPRRDRSIPQSLQPSPSPPEVGYVITGMLGITLSYHRQLSHRAFATPKWLEYVLAYCGALAVQGPPISWVSSHRHHHGNTDAEDDVHSPRDGFWWSHMGWLMDKDGTKVREDKKNASDISSQSYYRFLQQTYGLHCVVLPICLLYAFGGVPCVLWGFFARVVWFWHITWAVNSVSHVWGFQDWKTGDLSMNNWLVGILAFGEGWHNNHHAFERSCRHGLKWWQVDFTWYAIRTLEALGLAWNLQYPSQGRMERLAM
ncbi:unnamed protein product [Durusdinium trenchii]|uniref:Fatty acid desaturase domain-containing protein n=1 Tax=Durusdinium trenchii TaxID=1381693 RepID=A0ABP0S1M9_9DINO